MEETKGVDQLAAALARAQAKFKNPEKNRTVTVRHKTGGQHSYSYATLDAVLDSVRGPLADNKLAFVQRLDVRDGHNVLITTLLHESGQQISACYVLPSGLGVQEYGAAITYARRYSACPMLGIAGETDTDGEEAQAAQEQVDEQRKAESAAKLREMAKAGKLVSAHTGKPMSDDEFKAGLPKPKPEDDAIPMEFPKLDARLAEALRKDSFTVEQFKAWGVAKGNFPAETDVSKLPESFIKAVLANWDKVRAAIKESRKS